MELLLNLPHYPIAGDKLVINGIRKDDARFFYIMLVAGENSPDYKNVGSKLTAYFAKENDNNNIVFDIIKNGQVEPAVSVSEPGDITGSIFSDKKFRIEYLFQEAMLSISIDNTFHKNVELYDELKNLELQYVDFRGDIERIDDLEYQFVIQK